MRIEIIFSDLDGTLLLGDKGLSTGTAEALARALDRFPGTVLLVSHEADFYRAWAQRVVEIGGKGR